MIRMNNQLSINVKLYLVFAVISLIMIADFVIPGNHITDEIVEVKSERQQYFNAGGNAHYSYKVITNQHEFLVEERFSELVEDGEQIEYSISRIFKEINWYTLLSPRNKSHYSLRIMSGLILPLLVIIIMFASFKLKKRMSLLTFVLQILLLANLAFLLM